jgi:hypothetical protein
MSLTLEEKIKIQLAGINEASDRMKADMDRVMGKRRHIHVLNRETGQSERVEYVREAEEHTPFPGNNGLVIKPNWPFPTTL